MSPGTFDSVALGLGPLGDDPVDPFDEPELQAPSTAAAAKIKAGWASRIEVSCRNGKVHCLRR
jgi:hypothetical protein